MAASPVFMSNVLALDADMANTNTATTANSPPASRTRKRNKPTLNCLACVDRKSKCDRARPKCLLCQMRQTDCHYTPVAQLINVSRKRPRSPPLQLLPDADADRDMDNNRPASPQPTTHHVDALFPFPQPPDDLILPPDLPNYLDPTFHMAPLFGNNISDPYAAPLVLPSPPSSQSHPTERRALLNLFGATSTEHPFQSYWSDTGGLAEVVASLPPKADADTLIERFFDTVDPIYPIIPRDAFVANVKSFWLLSDQEKQRQDPAQVALQFAVYANAAYDIGLQDDEFEAHSQNAAFYLSCCHQSLCISNYFNRCSLLTVQSMILVCHFLISSNRIQDAWSMSGIVQRQIYGLKLNRSPEGLRLNLDHDTIQVRLRLWQAAMAQDTHLSLYLGKPPSTTHFDVSPDQLYHPPSTTPPPPAIASDVAYMRAMWQCSALIQETICTPRSKHQRLSIDATHRSQTVNRFRQLYAQFDKPFCQNMSTLSDNPPPRLLYQMVTLASTYFHALMLLLSEKNDKAGLHSDLHGAIHAAHEGMLAFFALVRLSPRHMRVWTEAHHRTYAMTAVMGTMLALHGTGGSAIADDARLMVGKGDFDRYIYMLGRAQGLADFRVVQRERLANLKALQAVIMNV